MIVLELEENALGQANLFDLSGHTLRFTPQGSGYRVVKEPLRWDPDFGTPLARAEVTLHQFAFPFSDKRWDSLLVGTTGTISFGTHDGLDPYGHSDGGLSLGRFDKLADTATNLIGTAPLISVFLKPRLSGPRYVKQLPDRVLITWDISEPFGGLLDFTWFKTVNLFQVVLHRDGSIEMSYQELAAKDAIVGLYPLLPGKETPVAKIAAGAHPSLAPYLDVRRVSVSVVDGTLLRVRLETRGPVPPEGDHAMQGIGYRVDFDAPHVHSGHPAAVWSIDGILDPYNPSGGPPQYVVAGPGVLPKAKISGNSITVEGVLPPALRGAEHIMVSTEVMAHAQVIEQVPPHDVQLSKIRTPEVHFSSLTTRDGPFEVVYEAFHYLDLPRPQDLSCTVLQTVGDKFDFLLYFSDFRIDNQEASSPSEGPAEENVTGIGQTAHTPASYCTQGRFQWGLAQPVFAGANEMQAWPPDGAPAGNSRDITYYSRQLAEASPEGKPLPYNYAMSNIGHEISHRWAAYVSAKVQGETISLGPWPHWAPGLQTRVAFPYQLPTEASTLGGSAWQDNSDGTYTQLRDFYFVPATGYSYLDLYLMGFLSPAEVPDFFLLTKLVSAGKDANGHPVFKAERTKLTIQDVIAAQGQRLPDADHSQRKFNTGVVILVEHGQSPSPELMERAEGVRRQWIYYWETATGHRSTMTASPR